MGLYVILVFTLLLTARNTNGFPEISIIDSTINNKGSVYQYHKTMFSGSEVHVELYCEKSLQMSVSWALVYSPCIDEFIFGNVTEIFSVDTPVYTLSDSIEYILRKETLSCNPSMPVLLKPSSEIHVMKTRVNDSRSAFQRRRSVSSVDTALRNTGLLATTWKDGAYALLIRPSCANSDCSISLRVRIEMPDSNGHYLSAVDFPFLPFNGFLSLLYLLGLGFWLVYSIRYWKEILRVQFFIGLVVFLGLWEHLTLFAIYATVDRTGQISSSAVYFAEFLSCLKRTLARFLVLIVCLGYGVTKPRLSSLWLKRFSIIGIIYFVLILFEGMTRASTYGSRLLLLTLFPLVCLDVTIIWWILIYLARTLRETRERNNLVKHKLYKHFGYVLVFVSILSLVFMVWSVFSFNIHPCISNWRFLWLRDTFWQSLFVIILTVILWLWRPTNENKQYAYSLLDSGLSADDGDQDEEEVVMEQFVSENNKVNKLHTHSSSTSRSQNAEVDNSKKIIKNAAPDSGQTPIPATIIERWGVEAASGPNISTPVWKTD